MKTIGNVQQDAQIRAVASGTLSNGDTIIVNSDGTVSAVSGNDDGAGTPGDISTDSNLSEPQAVYDPDQGKVIVAYHRDANAYYGAAVVGTISGTSISFGSVAKFQPNNTQGMQGLGMVYDTNADKVFISYADKNNSTYMTGVVGTVSGTSISFGTPTVFYSESGNSTSCAFDSTNNKILVAWRRGNGFGAAKTVTISGTGFSSGGTDNFNTGNIGRPSVAFSTSAGRFVIIYSDSDQLGHSQYIVATISGTSVSFGTEGDLNNVSTGYQQVAYNSTLDKFLAVYVDNATSPAGQGKGRVGTLSGTTVSWGSIAIFNSQATTFVSTHADSSGNMVVSFCDLGNSSYPTFASATISGTTVTFGSEVIVEAVNSESGAAVGKSLLAYDSTNNKFVLPYNDYTNNKLKSATLQLASTNLTSDNFIGFADSGYVNGQNVGVDSTCSINSGQTGLTAGQKYYVQKDGSLGETADDPSVLAGTAISATKILVKG